MNKKKYREAKKQYKITDEQKQKYREAKKRYRENMTDQQKQKRRGYQKDSCNRY